LSIPRHNCRHYPNGHSLRENMHIRFINRQNRTFDFIGKPGKVAVVICNIATLGNSLCGKLAAITGFYPAYCFCSLFDKVCKFARSTSSADAHANVTQGLPLAGFILSSICPLLPSHQVPSIYS